MKEIFFDKDVERMPEALGIPDERTESIEAEMASIMYKALNGRDKKRANSLYIMEEFVKLARTEEERLYCSWQAGRKAEEIKHRQNSPSSFLDMLLRGGKGGDEDGD